MIHLKMKNIMKSRKTTDSTRRKGRDAQADPDEDYLDQDYDDYDNEEEERIRRIKNKGLVRVSYLMVALFLSMAGYLIYFNVVLRDDINNNQYNTKQSAYQEQIIRGNIYYLPACPSRRCRRRWPQPRSRGGSAGLRWLGGAGAPHRR